MCWALLPCLTNLLLLVLVFVFVFGLIFVFVFALFGQLVLVLVLVVSRGAASFLPPRSGRQAGGATDLILLTTQQYHRVDLKRHSTV